jgi:hypothetical protein
LKISMSLRDRAALPWVLAAVGSGAKFDFALAVKFVAHPSRDGAVGIVRNAIMRRRPFFGSSHG